MNTKNHFFVTFYILLSMHLSCNIACLQAQNPMQDVIYLNDGSILRGRITERHTDSLLKVQIDGGSIFALNPSDIDSIKEEKRFQNSRNTLPGYYNQTGFTIVTGGDQSYPYYRDPLYVSFYSVHGYRFSNRIMTGGGAAMDLNSYLLLQFFADLRWEALKQSASPFAYVQGGYAYSTLRAGTTCGGGINQLDIVDLSIITSPQLVTSYQMSSPYGLGIDGVNLFVCDGSAGLKYYNAADPENLILHQVVFPGETRDVILVNGLLLAVTTEGFYEYDYTSGALQQLSFVPY